MLMVPLLPDALGVEVPRLHALYPLYPKITENLRQENVASSGPPKIRNLAWMAKRRLDPTQTRRQRTSNIIRNY